MPPIISIISNPETTGLTSSMMILSTSVSLSSFIVYSLMPALSRTSSTVSACPSQKPYLIASRAVRVSTWPVSTIPFRTIEGSTIAWAISGSRCHTQVVSPFSTTGFLPCDSAVARIMPRMNDWYLSGIFCPVWSTTVAAPILAPERIYMLSAAIAINAPADIAWLSMKTITGIS